MTSSARRAGAGVASWIASYYAGDYLESVERILTPERTSAEASFILEHTGLRPPARVVDFGCGHGRHAIELARRGFDVLGVDVNERPLALARAAAGADLPVRFLCRDYADPPAGRFDLVLSLFGSFGFAPDEDDARTLRAWCSRLDAGGWIVLELWHRDRIVCDFRPRRVWRASDDLEVDERRAFDPLTGRLDVEYRYTHADGRRAHHHIRVRLYTASEIASILASRQVKVTALFGSSRGEPYSVAARYLVVLAKKETR